MHNIHTNSNHTTAQHMAGTRPKISIIMPVFNRVDTIEKALKSLTEQSYDHYELIILDAGSTDGTVDIIKRYASYITYWHSKPDAGPLAAINAGIEMATGDLVATLMADDWYEPNTLQSVANTLMAQPEADIITCGGRLVKLNPKTQTYQTIWSFTQPQDLYLSFYNVCCAASAICCRFIRLSLYKRIGLYRLTNEVGKPLLSSDKEFLLRATLSQAKDVFTGTIGYNYYAHAGSSTFSQNKENKKRLFQEHMSTAQYLLTQELPVKYKWFLRYWYSEQSARLFAYQLIDKNFKQACLTALDGVKKYNALWPTACIGAVIQIVKKRCLRTR